jgi:hypothetical protein
LPLIRLASFVVFLAAVFIGSGLRAEELNIHFKTTPRVELVRPFADPVAMSLLVTGADGKPVRQGYVDVRLDAPKPGRFFSTDFPFVEGTRLNEMRLGLRQGRANWNYLLPIRGTYRLSVDVVTTDGKKASQIFEFKVRENERKWLSLGGFSIALFFLGFIAGRIFTPSRVAAGVLIVGAFLCGTGDSYSVQQAAEPLRAATLEIESAKVGTQTDVQWRLKGEFAGEKPVNFLTLTISHLEKGKVVFGVEKLAVASEFSMKFQFPDGAEFRVSTVANTPDAPAIPNERIVSVAGVEPPASAMVPALSYFLGLILFGLGAGRWSKLRKVS